MQRMMKTACTVKDLLKVKVFADPGFIKDNQVTISTESISPPCHPTWMQQPQPHLLPSQYLLLLPPAPATHLCHPAPVRHPQAVRHVLLREGEGREEGERKRGVEGLRGRRERGREGDGEKGTERMRGV